MALVSCPHCGGLNPEGAKRCEYCDMIIIPGKTEKTAKTKDTSGSDHYREYAGAASQSSTESSSAGGAAENSTAGKWSQYHTETSYEGVDPSWPHRSKIIAALLAIFLGGLGAHKFYLAQYGQGILFLVFCWTGIPEIIGFIQGITYLVSTDEKFMLRHRVVVDGFF